MTTIYITVCEGEIDADEHTVLISAVYKGETYYFCEQACLEDFWKNPDAFLVNHKPASPTLSLEDL